MANSRKRAYRRRDELSDKGSSLDRDLRILKARMPKVLGGEGKTRQEVAEEYNIRPQQVTRVLSRPDVRAVHREWVKGMLERQRQLGPIALEATKTLLQQADPTTVNHYWKRMGVDVSPEGDVTTEALVINAPAEILELVRKLSGGGDDENGGASGTPAPQP